MLAVIIESVKSIEQDFGRVIKYVEWGFTILFTIEYIARIWVIKKSWSYIFSFLGIVDLLSILPTYLSVFIVGTQSLLIIRVLRLLRVFRILKLARFVNAAKMISQALALMLMILGYAIIAVPTGIVTTEMVKANKSKTDGLNTQNCPSCSSYNHDDEAVFCKFCGEKLNV